jgi:hypothetical protein
MVSEKADALDSIHGGTTSQVTIGDAQNAIRQRLILGNIQEDVGKVKTGGLEIHVDHTWTQIHRKSSS